MSAPPTELILMRHGQTDWNVVRRVQGYFDQPLNDFGRLQASTSAQAVLALHQQRAFESWVSSDLQRARETAKLSTNQLQLHLGQEIEPKIDSLWRERNFGVLEGLTADEMLVSQPEVYHGWKSGDPDFQIPEGESLRQFSDRVRTAIEQTLSTHRGQRVLIATHGGTIEMARRIIADQALSMPRGYDIPNCSFSHILHRETDGYSLGPWVVADHLETLVRP